MTIKAVQNAKKIIICTLLSLSLSGCAGTIIAGLTLSQLLTAGSISSSLITGKGLGEHALDIVTGQDCRILEAVFRNDRAICEPKESLATNDDFKGLIALLDTPAGQDIQLADLPIGKEQYPTVTISAQKNSKSILAVLTRQPQQISSPRNTFSASKLAHLTEATKNYKPSKVRVNTVASSDLRERLLKKNLF
ncbi:MAG: hypothetical protein JKY12_01885 [Sneathiella sp.]|nr:hypothetical protein [Sneathiella sp.]